MFLKLAKRFELTKYVYAHRGLWTPDGAPENSVAAYKAAAEANIGLEFDVRPSADGTPMCFHDPLLDRMTDGSGHFEDKTKAELQACRLPNGEPIPTFDDLLSIWPEDLPLLIEMKIDGKTDPLQFSNIISEKLADFAGKAAMISFSEEAVSAVPSTVMRGQLIYPTSKVGLEKFERVREHALTRDVDFFAVNVADAGKFNNEGVPTVCWTVRTDEERANIHRLGFTEIFEHLPIPLAAGGGAR